MEPMFGTGNATVDRLSRLNFSGNVIPAAWYRTITRETGKPYLNAIVILSDIVYWYRAAEVRDEGSGKLLGYRKRFKSDLLQRSYQQLADQFGISKRDATNAIVALEKLGVVKRVFRTLTINGQAVPNVLFLELDVDMLERLTFPEREPGGKEEFLGRQKQVELDVSKTPGGLQEGCHLFEGDVPPKPERGVTQISETPPSYRRDGLPQMSGTNTEITYRDYNRENPIESYQEVKERFKEQIEYGILEQDRWDKEELDELVEVAVEVLVSKTDTIRVNREDKPAELVKDRYRRLTMLHIQYVLECLHETETKARNIRAVMITALYNAASTIGSYYGNLYRHHQGRSLKEG
ncbi:DUF6017 domain-containing protein [Lachnospiraceae bacterium HCP1S3_A8]